MHNSSSSSSIARRPPLPTPEDRLLVKQDSLEYFIKFPAPTLRPAVEHQPSVECDSISVSSEPKVPVVLLLGWAGCQDRYLMKYSKIYEDKGLITIRYTVPVENLFWKRDAMKPIGEKILKLLFEMNFDAHPIFFHVFSNGGAYLYQYITVAMEQSETPINICGIIFDSGPGDRRLMSLYRAISVIYGPHRRFNCLVSWMITLGMVTRWFAQDAFRMICCKLRLKPIEETNPYKCLRFQKNVCPQLFLYSKQDKLIPYKDIENFAEDRKKAGVLVEMVCFDGAEHVKLYSMYPQKYILCICRFLNDCLVDYLFGTLMIDKKYN